MLRLGEDPGKWYASDDFSSIAISLRRVAEGTESEVAAGGTDCDESEAVDVAAFEVYDRLYGKLEQMARSWAYDDDIFVEYSISSNEGCRRYCATEFYSNHSWNADPANLLVARFGAEVSPKACSARDVQFSHPTKTTERKANHERFLVESLTMTNDIETKFSIGRGKDKHPDESVSADHTMDNPVGFDIALSSPRLRQVTWSGLYPCTSILIAEQQMFVPSARSEFGRALSIKTVGVEQEVVHADHQHPSTVVARHYGVADNHYLLE